MENNKIIGSILLAGLIAMLSGTFAKLLYSPNVHAEEVRGFQVAVADTAAASGGKEEVDIMALIAAGNSAEGAKVAKKCLACHSFDKGGKNKVGPALWGIVGSKSGAVADFKYSDAVTGANIVWDYDNLWKYLTNPKDFIKGNKMAFAGIKKPEQLADLIAYLREQSDAPVALPKSE